MTDERECPKIAWRAGTFRAGTHADPDNSGQCVYCGRVLDGSEVLPELGPLTEEEMDAIEDKHGVDVDGGVTIEGRFVPDDPKPLTDKELASRAIGKPCPVCGRCVDAITVNADAPITLHHGSDDVCVWTPKPLTDEELTELLYACEAPTEEHDIFVLTRNTPRLVAEVRRLRSDEWLERAANEIAIASLEWKDEGESERCDEALDLLKRWRA